MGQVGAPVRQALPFTVTVPAGTQINAPAAFPLAIGDSWVYSIEVEVPKGSGGAMGFNIAYAGTQIIPWSTPVTWLVVENYRNTFQVDAEMGNGLVLKAYNTGYWNHQIFLRVNATPISAYLGGQAQAPVAPLDLSSIGG